MIYLKNTTEPQQLMIGITTGGYTYIPNGGGGESSEGYDEGYDDGYDDGYKKGQTDGYNKGQTDGYATGKSDGYADGKSDGYTEGKADGYSNGKADGYADGKTDGIVEQKSKLSSLVVTENGTYTKDDGYNKVDVEVPSREPVLKPLSWTVKENNWEMTFSKPTDADGYCPVVIKADIKEKYTDAQVEEIRQESYNNGYAAGDEVGYQNGVEAGKTQQKAELIELTVDENGTYEREDGYNKVTVDITLPKIQEAINVELSAGETGVITPSEGYDVLKKVNYTVSASPTTVDFEGMGYAEAPLPIVTAITYSNSVYDKWNKGEITNFTNDNNLVFCPIIDVSSKISLMGFFSGATNLQYIPPLNTSEMENMVGGLSGMCKGCSSLTYIAPFDTSKADSVKEMFSGCSKLEQLPLLDTSNVRNMSYMFSGCSKLKELPNFNTSRVTDMSYMFRNCTSLINTNSIKDWITSNLTTTYYMFNYCTNLTDFEVNWDTSKVTEMSHMFDSATKLTNIGPINCSSVGYNKYPVYSYSEIASITGIGGFIGMKSSWDSTYGLAKCPNLTYQSCINILNGLYDFTGNGETPSSSQGVLKVHYKFLTAVGDEISIGTDKGWKITS